MRSYLRLSGVVAAAAALTVACSNSEEASTETSTTPPTTVAAPATSTSSAPSSSAAADEKKSASPFCATLEAQDASLRTFGILQIFSPSTARTEAQDARKQMGSATPPAEIAQDWTTWSGYLDFVVAQTETSTAASSATFEKLNTAQEKAKSSGDTLRAYYGDTCL